MTNWTVPYRSMNLAVYTDKLNEYRDMDDLKSSYEKGNLNGLEVVLAMDESAKNRIPKEMIHGVHLFFHTFWMDLWKGNYSWLLEQFDDENQMLEYFSGGTKEDYLNCFRHDLEYAKEIQAKYVVFHVSEVNLEEAFTNMPRYSHEEVIDAAIEVVNTLLDGQDYDFEFLVENLPWDGFSLADPVLTRRMLDGIHYEKKGIMLDTGHYLNLNPELETGEEALAYLHKMLDRHEAAGVPIIQWIKGMHLQLSLSGEFVKAQEKMGNPLPEGYRDLPFYERMSLAYWHIKKIDQHRPFLVEGIDQLIGRIRPDYLTEEFSATSREEYEEWIRKQKRYL